MSDDETTPPLKKSVYGFHKLRKIGDSILIAAIHARNASSAATYYKRLNYDWNCKRERISNKFYRFTRIPVVEYPCPPPHRFLPERKARKMLK